MDSFPGLFLWWGRAPFSYLGAYKLLSHEVESALRAVRRFESAAENKTVVEESVDRECLSLLLDGGYIKLTFSTFESFESGLGEDRYERTRLGRSYFSDLRREWFWRNSSSLVALVGTLSGIVLGYMLGRIS